MMVVICTVAQKNNLKPGVVIPPALLFFAEDCFGYLVCFVLPSEFRIFKNFCEEHHWDFEWDCIESVHHY
jgi:hypothetical protein